MRVVSVGTMIGSGADDDHVIHQVRLMVRMMVGVMHVELLRMRMMLLLLLVLLRRLVLVMLLVVYVMLMVQVVIS